MLWNDDAHCFKVELALSWTFCFPSWNSHGIWCFFWVVFLSHAIGLFFCFSITGGRRLDPSNATSQTKLVLWKQIAQRQQRFLTIILSKSLVWAQDEFNELVKVSTECKVKINALKFVLVCMSAIYMNFFFYVQEKWSGSPLQCGFVYLQWKMFWLFV